MLQRIMVAVVCVPLIFLVFFFAPPIVLPIVISFLSMIGVHEVLWSTGFVKNLMLSGCSIVLAGLIPFWEYYGQDPNWALAVIFLYFLLVFTTAISSHYTVTVEKLGGSFFFAVLIPFFLSSFIRLDRMPQGKFLILMPLVAAFLSDATALFVGVLLGKHKLAPELSPKKTVEGAIGGLLGATVFMVVYGLVLGHWFQMPTTLWRLALYGLLGAVVSQVGDLSFSYIKRQYNLKDFGNMFPGHGGVLDRFDSVIFCAPLIELLHMLLPAIQPICP